MTSLAMKNYYNILQVDPKADKEIIEVVYKKLAFRYHPDRNKTPSALIKMQDINEAYEVLRDPASRRNFDVTFSPTNTYTNFHSQDLYSETQRLKNELFLAKQQISAEKEKSLSLESRLGEMTTQLQKEQTLRNQLEQRTQLAEYARLAFEKATNLRKTRNSLQKRIRKTPEVKSLVFVVTYLLIMPLEIFISMTSDLGTSWNMVGITSMLLFLPLIPAYGMGAFASAVYKKHLTEKLKHTT
ncbi:MAG: J domain-containing protein [Anaerolineales bacterium]|nr:J domain-containing protein [Anaerolineales bacterium]